MNAPESGDVVERLAKLAAYGAYEGGIDRGLFTAAEHGAREMFANWARAAGLTVSQDRAGNVFARLGASDEAPILTGSHLDTVKTGGPYDGAYGVVAALCALEQLKAQGISLRRPFEAVAWAGEEGSRFPLGCLGSGAYAGINPLSEVEALEDDDGVTFAEARVGSSGWLAGIPLRDTAPALAAYLELHVEQGPLLERAGARLGIVSTIAAQRRYEVEVRGEAGHAGTLPMEGRHDAFCAAAEIALALEAEARALGECVLTVGYVAVEPNQTNIVPGSTRFRVDARSAEDARVAKLGSAVESHCRRVAVARGVACNVHLLESRAAVPMDAHVRAVLRETLAPLDAILPDIPSGAGHDAMCLAKVAPAAMIFVPSAGGRSHVGNEFTEPEDLRLGVEALTRALCAVDRMLGG